MRNRNAIVCGVLLVAGTGLIGGIQARAADDAKIETKHAAMTPLALPDGFTVKDLKETSDIEKRLAKVTSSALTKDNFNDLLGYLVDEDRIRTKDSKEVTESTEIKNRDYTALNNQIEQINKAWKAKYGKEFSVADAAAAYKSGFAILTGEVTDPTAALTTWPVAAVLGEANMNANTPEVRKENDKTFGGSKNLEKGRNVALIRLPAMHDKPAITVSMIHELPDFWRVDVPNNRTNQMIYDDLLKHLSTFAAHADKWPADVNDAYRASAHCVFAAIYGVDMPTDEKAAAAQ